MDQMIELIGCMGKMFADTTTEMDISINQMIEMCPNLNKNFKMAVLEQQKKIKQNVAKINKIQKKLTKVSWKNEVTRDRGTKSFG
ncbi:hypothetical protein [Helicobacter suis]|uniref:hypothetical protein n=1 Tax=Helicobacter suis TaxID=104628 RepID=UPI0013D61BD8|nr:hypothetical protein [Helicobacter suis]